MSQQQPSLIHPWSRQAILENMGREAEPFRACLWVFVEMGFGERGLAAACRALAGGLFAISLETGARHRFHRCHYLCSACSPATSAQVQNYSPPGLPFFTGQK